MKNPNIQGTGAKIVVVLAMLFIILGVTVMAFGEWTGMFSMFPVMGVIGDADMDRIYYPQMFSLCCEEVGANDWVPMPDRKIETWTKSFSCPDTTSMCRFREPEIRCPGIGWSHPLGTTGLWHISHTDQDGDVNTYCNIPIICQSITGDIQFKRTESVEYLGACIDNSAFINPNNIAKLLSFIRNEGITLSEGNLKIDAIHTKIKLRRPSGGDSWVSGTSFCMAPDTISYQDFNILKNNEPKQNILDKVKSMAENMMNTNLDAYTTSDPTGTAKEANFPLRFGECITGVENWIEVPGWGTINKQGQYQGKDVVCNNAWGLVEIELIETHNNIKYYAPTKKLTEPPNFCCSNTDCDLQFPNKEYGCENYQCKEGATPQCVSDLDCEPAGGINQGANCYRDTNSGKFYLHSSLCLHGQCTPPITTEVECCPDYCSSFGQKCDYYTGCKDIVLPKPDCPPGMCCDGFLNKPQQCSGELVCCLRDSPHNGHCETYEECYGSVPPPIGCLTDDDCNDEEWTTIDSCKRSLIQQALGQRGTCSHFGITPILAILVTLIVLTGMGLFIALLLSIAVILKKRQQGLPVAKVVRRKR